MVGTSSCSCARGSRFGGGAGGAGVFGVFIVVVVVVVVATFEAFEEAAFGASQSPIAARTSPFTSAPRAPVGVIVSGSNPLSARSLRTDGHMRPPLRSSLFFETAFVVVGALPPAAVAAAAVAASRIAPSPPPPPLAPAPRRRRVPPECADVLLLLDHDADDDADRHVLRAGGDCDERSRESTGQYRGRAIGGVDIISFTRVKTNVREVHSARKKEVHP